MRWKRGLRDYTSKIMKKIITRNETSRNLTSVVCGL